MAPQTITNAAFYCALDPFVGAGRQCTVELATYGAMSTTTYVIYQQDTPGLPPNFYDLSGLSVAVPAGDYSIIFDTNVGGNTPYTLGTLGGSAFLVLTTNNDPIQDRVTHITALVPASGSTVGTSSVGTLGATGYITSQDWFNVNQPLWRVKYILTPPDILGINPLSYTAYTYISTPLFFSTTTQNFFDGQSIGFMNIGRYTLSAQLQQKTSGFFANLLGNTWQTVDATTTQFTISTTTATQKFLDQQKKAFSNSDASSTVSLADCLKFDIGDCARYLVIPSQESFTAFDDLNITRKPPLGYFFAVKDLFATSTASTTPDSNVPSVFFFVTIYVSSWFDPILTPIGDVILLLLAIWILHRISNWEWSV